MDPRKQSIGKTTGYAPINGLKMYYEIEGTGDPLVYIPPVFGIAGMKTFPALAENHAIISVDLQGNGRTADIANRPLSIAQYARDVIALLDYLCIKKADFLGESYGAATVVTIAIDRPDRVNRVATYGGTFGPPHTAHNTAMLHFDELPTPESPCFAFQKDAYQKVAPHPEYWPDIWQKALAIRWEGFSDEQLASIAAPLLIIVGDRDFVRVEHAVETVKRIPQAELAVIPDAGHFALFSESEKVIPAIKFFLEKPAIRLPLATAQVGYHPGQTR